MYPPPHPPALAQPSPLTLCQLCVCQFKGVLADFKSTHTTTANLQLGQSDNGRCCSEEGGGAQEGDSGNYGIFTLTTQMAQRGARLGHLVMLVLLETHLLVIL